MRFLAASIAAGALLVVSSVATTACVRGPIPLGARGPRYAPSSGCPFGVRGVRVETLETDDGIDVALTTGGGTLDDLRNRAHYAIQGHTEPGMIVPTGVQRVPPLKTAAHVGVEDISGGVAIRVEADNMMAADDLRDEIYARLERVEDPNSCN